MSFSVTMPRLGESVTEGTVTRWLKNEGDRVEADEPLLEVSTDKVDTEIPSPTAGILTSIKVREDETVEVGVELAVIGDAAEAESGGAESTASESAADAAPAADEPPAPTAQAPAPVEQAGHPAAQSPWQRPAAAYPPVTPSAPAPAAAAASAPPAPAAPPAAEAPPSWSQAPAPQAPPVQLPPPPAAPAPAVPTPTAPASAPAAWTGPAAGAETPNGTAATDSDPDDVAGTYVTPLVRKLATEHGVDLSSVHGTGVGGRIRKADVLASAAATAQEPAPSTPAPSTPAPAATPPAAPSAPAAASPVLEPNYQVAATHPATGPLPRARVEKMSRMRQVIAARMVESLQTSAQLTTVVEVDVTKVARLRDQAKRDFEEREGVKLSFLPFFAVAAVEALKAHPVVNCSISVEDKTITYHDAEHLAIAVDTERGLVVPVIHNAGDLNLAGIARKIADLAERTRANKISPDELSGGTFTLTNTGSRGALFDTPIINQPQVAILGTGTVVKRAVVLNDANLGETIAVRSMVYLALSYDHRIVDGADAARFLTTMKTRLEGGEFERDLGLA